MVMQNSRSCVTGTTATNALVCFGAGAERKHSARALGSWHGCYRCALVEDSPTATVESELSLGTPVCSPLRDGSLHHVFTPRQSASAAYAPSLVCSSVYVRGRGAKQQPKRRTPASAPTHRASGSLACQPEPLQRLRRYPLGTCRRGGASRAFELQPGRGMRRSRTLCPISRTSTDQVIQDLADMLGSVCTAHLSATSTISPTCGAFAQRATSKSDLSCLDRRWTPSSPSYCIPKVPLQASLANAACMDALSSRPRHHPSLANVPVGDHHPA
ncbi:hypothetical protein Q7P35_000574 [Cladosporium inversicolor]